MQYMHTVEYYLAITKNEALIHIIKWIILKNILLRERNQSQKTTHCMIVFI